MFDQEIPTLKSSKLRFRPGEQRTILLLGDFLIAVIAFILALYIWGTQPTEWLRFSLDFLQQRVPLWFYLLPIAWLLLLLDLYDVRNANNWAGTLRGILTTGIAGLLIYAIIYLLSPKGSLPRIGVGIFLVNATILTLIWRWIYIKIFELFYAIFHDFHIAIGTHYNCYLYFFFRYHLFSFLKRLKYTL